MKTLKDKNGNTLGTFLEQGDASGGSQLQYITVYAMRQGYPLYFTMQVDDSTLETYSDLYNYLVRKGLVMTETTEPSACIVGNSDEGGRLVGISVSTFEGDEYIDLITSDSNMNFFETDITDNEFSITYLGQENNEE